MIQVDLYGEYVRARSLQTGTVMQMTAAEWAEFVEDVKEGHWDIVPNAPDERSFECPTK